MFKKSEPVQPYPPFQGFVLVHKKLGIYLGQLPGLTLWSKADTGGQDSASFFDKASHAIGMCKLLERRGIEGIELYPMLAQDRYCATMAECIEWGLPGWEV